MLRHLSILLLFLVITSVSKQSHSQNKTIDSLLFLLKKDKEDTNKVNHLNKLCWEYQKIGNYDTAFQYGKPVLQLAKQLNYSQGITTALNNFGAYYYYQGNYDKALENFFAAVEINEKTGNKRDMAALYSNIAAIYSKYGNYSKAMENCFAALKIKEQIGDTLGMAPLYGNIGTIYNLQGNYTLSLENYSKALKIFEKTNNKYGMSLSYNNIGTIYYDQNKYELALEKFFMGLRNREEIGDKQGMANSYNNIGSVYEKLKQPLLAIQYTCKALDFAKQAGSKEDIRDSYRNFSGIYSDINDYKKAFQNYQLYSQIKDSIFNEESSKQISEMQTKYETEKKDNQIKNLEKESVISNLEIKEQNLNIQKRNYLLIAVLLLFLMLATGVYFWFSRQRLKNLMMKEKIIKETEENERLRMAKDIHDDLGSGLSKINFLSEIICQKSEQFPDIRNNSESIKETIQKVIESMHDLIWTLNPENTTLANLIARMREYAADYLEDFPIELKFSFPDTIPQTPITKESYRELFMVVKESLNNISKHSMATEVFFNVTLTNEDLLLAIQDNGIGFNSETISKGNGLRNMQNRISALGGLFNLNSKPAKNTLISISVPFKKILKL